MHPAAIILLVLLIVQRLSELALARRNARRAIARGGREYGAGHYPLIVALHVSWFLAWVVEHILRGGQLWHPWWPLAVMLFGTQIVRYWTIATLGEAWNTRIIVVPGNKRVSGGPFRWFSHPNYVVVLTEFFIVPMLVGSYVTAIVGTLLNYFILTRIRIPAEEDALTVLGETD
ncbi:MAG: hypothetical protein FGM32_08875 [Candidatus Kapabacteria bacterium]|nr:hypothetical protein [Candidatus Kapabacteria bacterium]